MNLEQLRKKAADALEKAKGIRAKCQAENREPSEQENSEFDGAMKEHRDALASIKRLEDLQAAERDEQQRSQSRRSVIRETGTEVHDNAEDAPFRNFGEFLQCVRGAAIQPSAIDPRLLKRAALGANEKIGSEGGFLVGKDESQQILQDMHDVGILAPRCTEVPISANSNGIIINGVDESSRVDGSRWGGVRAYWADEAGTTTATKPAFRQVNLKLNKLFAVFYATDEMIADAAALGSLASRAFSEEMAFKVDDGIFRGVGAGQPQGVLNSGVLVSVSKETGQGAATILYENIIKMYARMPARSKARAAWFIHDDVMPQLMLMTLPGGTSSTPVYLPPSGAAAAPFGTIFGRPVIPIEHCETLGTVGDILFADFSQYYLATKGGVQQAESMHVQFLTGEMTFRFTYRVDGQTARSKKLTPYKGSNELSPFVVLATRA